MRVSDDDVIRNTQHDTGSSQRVPRAARLFVTQFIGQ